MQLFFLWSLYIVFSGAMGWYVYTKVQHFYHHTFGVTYCIIVYNNNNVMSVVLICYFQLLSDKVDKYPTDMSVSHGM